MSCDCRAPRKDIEKDKGKGKSQANIMEEMEDSLTRKSRGFFS